MSDGRLARPFDPAYRLGERCKVTQHENPVHLVCHHDVGKRVGERFRIACAQGSHYGSACLKGFEIANAPFGAPADVKDAVGIRETIALLRPRTSERRLGGPPTLKVALSRCTPEDTLKRH